MQALEAAKPLTHAMHIDVSVAREYVKARLDVALAAGGRIVDEPMRRRTGHWPTAPVTACASARGPMPLGQSSHTRQTLSSRTAAAAP